MGVRRSGDEVSDGCMSNVEGDTGQMQGRCEPADARGDAWEVHGRCRVDARVDARADTKGDAWELQGRWTCMGDAG